MILQIIVGKSSSSRIENCSDFHHFLVFLLGTGTNLREGFLAFDCLTEKLTRRELL